MLYFNFTYLLTDYKGYHDMKMIFVMPIPIRGYEVRDISC